MSSLLVGSVVRLDFAVTVDNVATDPTAVTLTVELPDGTFDAGATVIRDAVGIYHADYVPSAAGTHVARWVATGTAAATDEQPFDVRPAYSTAVTVVDVKLRLNKTLNVDDDEIQSMLDAALAEYEEHVGPLTAGTNVPYYGGPFPRGAVDVVITDVDGSVVSDYGYSYTASPYLYWNVPAQAMGHGLYSTEPYLFITYTVGALPANHREAIIADVAGYFEVTQRGGGSLRPSFPGDGEYEAAYAATPQVLFPRIRALASQSARIG